MGTFGGAGGGVFGGGGGGGATPTGTTPVKSIIMAALRKAHVTLVAGITPNADKLTEALDEINRLIGTMNCTLPNIFTIRIDQFPLTGAKSYTIGKDPSGAAVADFDAPRPQQITEANLLFPTDPVIRRPIRLLTDEEWSEITLQDIPNGPVFRLYNDGGYPFSTLFVWPQSPSGYQLELFSWQAIPKFSTTADVVTLPDGYEDFFVCSLAPRLAQLHGLPVHPDLRLDAQRTRAALASKNASTPPKRTSDAPGVRGKSNGFNYLIGV